VKKLIYLIPILILVAIFAFLKIDKPSVVSAGTLPFCNDSVSYCVEKVNCKTGFNCELRTAPLRDCRAKISKNCKGGICITHGCAGGFAPAYAGFSMNGLLGKIGDWFAKPCYGTNCWSGGDNKGWRDNTNLTGAPGSIKSCEAKLHVCFNEGAGDPAIPCNIASPAGCMAACGSPSNVACDVAVCNSRCMAARVPGSADTCD